MTTISTQGDDRPGRTADDDARLRRRAVLDLSIDEELVRGDRRGVDLCARQRAILALVVENELRDGDPLTETAVIEATRARRPFSAARQRPRIDALATIGLLRRDGADLRATVAGIAAIVRPSLLDRPHPPRVLLRALRRAELLPV
ncbi:hypothetical protein [Microbacterium sp. NPDC089696]|jgi:hypothetical protein|uniref:hypothetical protein n=1 Tax=Microbacterium sp. NPDC089696 TaxID=3364199 RepID=UPI00382A8D7D